MSDTNSTNDDTAASAASESETPTVIDPTKFGPYKASSFAHDQTASEKAFDVRRTTGEDPAEAFADVADFVGYVGITDVLALTGNEPFAATLADALKAAIHSLELVNAQNLALAAVLDISYRIAHEQQEIVVAAHNGASEDVLRAGVSQVARLVSDLWSAHVKLQHEHPEDFGLGEVPRLYVHTDAEHIAMVDFDR